MFNVLILLIFYIVDGVWFSIHADGGEIYDEEEMETFVNAMEAHFYPFFKIHLSVSYVFFNSCDVVSIGK